jgi:hypothetical protein
MPAQKLPAAPLAQPKTRVFKAGKFAVLASKRGITDQDLCAAIAAVQASPRPHSLGGGVYKKSLNDNMDRSIILAKGGKHWFYTHLFQKSDTDNISRKELEAFKEAAETLGNLSEDDLNAAVKAGKLKEICHDCSIEKGE